jgi:D-alanyl-lipoteichoic acid acyltransferase DltB (MBOAT superfamily)
MPQFFEVHTFNERDASDGIRIMAVGFFKKLVVADTLSYYVNYVYNDLSAQHGLSLIVATVLFAFQIYCDFSGYSDIAVGAARILGFRLMKNFDSPYLAHSIRDFWRRWHISLSTWFSDYVYIPLGGNRVKLPRYYFNLFITFLVSGLWHGANWTFIIWGALHGFYRIVGALRETARKRRGLDPAPERTGLRGSLDIAITFFLVTVGWVFFRAASLSDAMYVFQHCLDGIGSISEYLRDGFVTAAINKGTLVEILVSLCALILIDFTLKKTNMLRWLDKQPAVLRWGIYVTFVCLIAILSEKGIAARFIYFQF